MKFLDDEISSFPLMVMSLATESTQYELWSTVARRSVYLQSQSALSFIFSLQKQSINHAFLLFLAGLLVELTSTLAADLTSASEGIGMSIVIVDLVLPTYPT